MHLFNSKIYQMAIIFTTDISEDKLLMAYNNNVVRFSSDSDLTPLHCDIIGLGIDARIYPVPDMSFYFNLKDYISSEINTNRFADELQSNLISDDSNTFTYDVANGCFAEGMITFKINFIDLTSESVTKSLNFLTGVFQIDDWKKQEIANDANYVVLSPVEKRSNNTSHLKFWEGYPFEFSFYTSNPNESFTLKNNTTANQYDFMAKSKVTSLFLSDGRTDVTLDNFIPLVEGRNELNILKAGVNQDLNIFIDKADADCGVYIKWLNSLGRWNYWLLGKHKKQDRAVKYSSDLENDYSNLDATFSPTLQLGKTSADVLKCFIKNLSESEKLVFSGLFDSPKIYYFTGERFSRATFQDWIEVTLKTTSANIFDSNKKLYSYAIDLQLPERYTQKL